MWAGIPVRDVLVCMLSVRIVFGPYRPVIEPMGIRGYLHSRRNSNHYDQIRLSLSVPQVLWSLEACSGSTHTIGVQVDP